MTSSPFVEKPAIQVELDKLCAEVNALRRIYGYAFTSRNALYEQLDFLEQAHSKDEEQKEACAHMISYLKEKMDEYTAKIAQRQPRIDQLVSVIMER